MIETPQLSAISEDKEHLAKTIGECYNKFDHYQVQTGIDLLSQAYYLLHDDVYKLWTDGRRILAFPNRNIQEDSITNTNENLVLPSSSSTRRRRGKY
ncbi:hypothetical protein Gotur_005244 [Gossypium turneri]